MQSHKENELSGQKLDMVTGGVSKPEKGTCPKCGSSSVETYWGAFVSIGVYVGVKCRNCGYKGPEQLPFPPRLQ